MNLPYPVEQQQSLSRAGSLAQESEVDLDDEASPVLSGGFGLFPDAGEGGHSQVASAKKAPFHER